LKLIKDEEAEIVKTNKSSTALGAQNLN